MGEKHLRKLGGSVYSTKKVETSFGLKILEKCGWKSGDGLGKSGQGMKECIQITKRYDENEGLGKKKAKMNDQWWENNYNSVLKNINTSTVRTRSRSGSFKNNKNKYDSCSDDDSDSSSSSESIKKVTKVTKKNNKNDVRKSSNISEYVSINKKARKTSNIKEMKEKNNIKITKKGAKVMCFSDSESE